MLLTTDALVLQTTRYGDSSLIVHLFTREAGMLSCVARYPRSTRGRVRSGTRLFQPLSVVEVTLDVQASRALASVREVHVACPYSRIPFDPVRGAIALFLAEFLNYVLSGEGENRPLFLFLEESMRWLDSTERGMANFHIVFLFRLSLFLGIRPFTEDYAEGAFFDLREGCFTMLRPLHPDYLPADESERFARLLRMRFETMHLFPFSRVQRNRCLELLVRYYRLHVPSLPELKSLDVLRELFD